MTDSAPRPVSRRSVLRGAAALGAATAAGPLLNLATAGPAHAADPAPAADGTAGSYTIRFDQAAKQTIKGLGFEIQSDSIASGNAGLPTTVSGVPYDLTTSERSRFYSQLLKAGRADHGFRYCRLALGLFHRGVDPTGKYFVDRYTGQTALLADMIQQAGIEGVAAEYWSPAPGWKSNNALIGGSLASFAPADLSALGDAMVTDLNYLSSRGVPIKMWGLQNEPDQGQPAQNIGYSTCVYSTSQYLQTFKAVAPKIRAAYPNAMIHANSEDGCTGPYGTAIRADATALSLVDAWTFHKIGSNSDVQITDNFTSKLAGKVVFNNEFEYLNGAITDWRCVNTAQSIMNWMTFQNSPTWFWLHALKPTTNSESAGYGLGFWRPPSDTDFSHFPNIPVGHWDFNPRMWNAVAGFLQYMPWDSVRYGVDEPVGSDGKPLRDHRIMAWKTPQGKAVLVVTNRNPSTSFTYTVNTQTTATFQGSRFGPATNNQFISSKTGPTLTITVPPMSVEFWVRTP
ncbi:glycoside hydrolase family 30 beta sandwich domain-containing protein [Kitasatospora sp. NPDC003701]